MFPKPGKSSLSGRTGVVGRSGEEDLPGELDRTCGLNCTRLTTSSCESFNPGISSSELGGGVNKSRGGKLYAEEGATFCRF
jgi:hypothetical protein